MTGMQCDAVDPTGQRCVLQAGHDGNHVTAAQLAPVQATAPVARGGHKGRNIGIGAAVVLILAAIGQAGSPGGAPGPTATAAALVAEPTATATPFAGGLGVEAPTSTPAPVATPLAIESAPPTLSPNATARATA